MLLEPAASLSALDDAPARRWLMQAMGESGARKFQKSAGDPEFWTQPQKAGALK